MAKLLAAFPAFGIRLDTPESVERFCRDAPRELAIEFDDAFLYSIPDDCVLFVELPDRSTMKLGAQLLHLEHTNNRTSGALQVHGLTLAKTTRLLRSIHGMGARPRRRLPSEGR